MIMRGIDDLITRLLLTLFTASFIIWSVVLYNGAVDIAEEVRLVRATIENTKSDFAILGARVDVLNGRVDRLIQTLKALERESKISEDRIEKLEGAQ